MAQRRLRSLWLDCLHHAIFCVTQIACAHASALISPTQKLTLCAGILRVHNCLGEPLITSLWVFSCKLSTYLCALSDLLDG